MSLSEIHVEKLLGRRVRDVDGHVIGRLEELHVELRDSEHVVTEFLIGPAAALERIGVFLSQMPYFRLLPMPKTEYCVPWELMDLSDLRHPRVRARRDELRKT